MNPDPLPTWVTVGLIALDVLLVAGCAALVWWIWKDRTPTKGDDDG